MPEATMTGRGWAALWTVYLVWGSTYLAIRVAVHPTHGAGIPPLLLAGVRFVLAGAALFALTARRPAPDGRPDPLGARQWWATAVVGTALCFGGNGLVSVAERRIPSGTAAVVVATVPIWTAALAALVGRERLSARHAVGLVAGFGGVAALVVGQGAGRADALGVLTVIAAAATWAGGSFWSQTAPMPRRPLVMTGMEMLCGGAVMTAVAVAIGEPSQLHLDRVPASAWWAFAFLVTFGSMLAYTAYVWLLRTAPLSLVTTYAYVNPLVAVLLGWLLLSEHVGVRTAVATVAIVGGVLLIVRRRAEPPAASAGAASPLPRLDDERREVAPR